MHDYDTYGVFSAKAQELESENKYMKHKIDTLQSDLYDKMKQVESLTSKLDNAEHLYKESLNTISNLRLENKTTHDQILRGQIDEQAKYINILESRLAKFRANQELTTSNSPKCCKCCCDCSHESYSPNTQRTNDLNSKLQHEIKEWTDFCYRIYGVVALALQQSPDFPSCDPEGQRRVTMNLVRKLTKVNSEGAIKNVEYEQMRKKYFKNLAMTDTLQNECDNIHNQMNAKESMFSERSPTRRYDGEVTKIDNYVNSAFNCRERRGNSHLPSYDVDFRRDAHMKNSPRAINENISSLSTGLTDIDSVSEMYNKRVKNELSKLHSVTKKLKNDYNAICRLTEHANVDSVSAIDSLSS